MRITRQRKGAAVNIASHEDGMTVEGEHTIAILPLAHAKADALVVT